MSASLTASVAHMVAKLLARRTTTQEEIPLLMDTVETALLELEAPPRPVVAQQPAPVIETEPKPRSVRRPRRVAVVGAAPPTPQPPVQPKLVRRAELAPAAPVHREEAALAAASPRGMVRGIVKWFDQRARRGALRLPGCADDVAVESGLLDDMAITRLYKGQEIEAVLADDAAPRVVRLAIPGGAWQVQATGGFVRNRNHARPVVVELKREALRRIAARVEAEHLLGRTRAR